ncbi:MAG TPA: hypothetical protein VF346_03175 [Bacteroidales bacterium]
MEKIGIRLFILILILCTGCDRDAEQAKRYSDMISECDSIIGQANLVIKDQRARVESLHKKREDGLKAKMPEYKLLRIDRETIDASKIESNTGMVIKHLEAIKIFAKVGEKVNKRIIYFKRKYINYSTTIQVHDENIMIQEITDGLSAKQYISKYLPKESK